MQNNDYRDERDDFDNRSDNGYGDGFDNSDNSDGNGNFDNSYNAENDDGFGNSDNNYGSDGNGRGYDRTSNGQRGQNTRNNGSNNGKRTSGGRNGGNSGNANNGKKTAGGAKKGKKETINLKESPSARPIHRIMPCILVAFSAFLFVCMFLGLVSGEKMQSPDTHPIGAVGYGLCRAFFGLFGASGFLLPVLLCQLALTWRRWVNRRRLPEKVITPFVLQILLSTFVHECCLGALEKSQRAMSAKELFNLGAKLQGGGFIGGGIGYFFCSRMNVFGAIFLTVLLLIVTIFFFIGMTPQHLMAHVKARAEIRRANKQKLGAEDLDRKKKSNGESQNIMGDMTRKHDRASGKVTEDIPPEPPTGAVIYPNGKSASRAMVSRNDVIFTDESNPAPLLPRLDASDDTQDGTLVIPDEIEKKLENNEKKDEKIEEKKPETTQTAQTVQQPQQKAQPAQPAQPAKPAEQTKPRVPTPEDRAKRQAENDALDQIFPQSAERRNISGKVQKSDRGFELGSIFVDGPDAEIPPERRHVPLPPEVPLPDSVKRSEEKQPTANGVQQTPQPQPTRPVQPRPARPMQPVIAGYAKTPSNTPIRPESSTVSVQPTRATLRPAEVKGPQDFGLSDEVLDAIDASNVDSAREDAKKNGTKPVVKKVPAPPKPKRKPYNFPPVTLLSEGKPMSEQAKEELESNARRIEEKLRTFHIGVNEITYSCGPTVTRYEVFPDAHVRVKQIFNMDRDIALTFGVKDVRIDSIEGKSAIGVEVPNKIRSTVYLRGMIESPLFADKKSPLYCCLGSDVAGMPVYFDLEKMPHLLVAGQTKSGKSVCINCMIMSILYHATPDEVRLIMIDPKKVEFIPYDNIPHLLAPIITSSKDAAGALQAALNEMEARYEKLADAKVRNLEKYNELAKTNPDITPMCRIVIIIDEFADLMMQARNEVEPAVGRLLQKARAAGIYLIIGTQRPSVDVIPGTLKSNLNARIACALPAFEDSKTALGRGGAEKLLGQGDMLFNPPEAHDPIRVQGAFLPDEEVESICDYLRASNDQVEYDDEFVKQMHEYTAQAEKKKEKGDSEKPSSRANDGDRYKEAVRLAVDLGKISTSMIQRKMGLGYNKAAGYVDRMEEEGIVTPADGVKPRTVLLSAEQYLERYFDDEDGEGDSEE